MDVLTAAWRGSGCPGSTEGTDRGVCARCGVSSTLTAVGEVVSRSFTGFDQWVEPAGSGVCPACSWVFRTPILRTANHLVTRDPVSCQQIDRGTLVALLHRALPASVAVVVPLRPGRKHVLPMAAWGQVAVDNAVLPWTAMHAGVLQVVIELRRAGFGSRMLQEPAPTFEVLQRLPQPRWASVMDAWRLLDPWRAPDNPWFSLALHLTLPRKDNR